MVNVEGKVRKAIEDYSMIEDGDKIAVALSGGKDSAAMLLTLSRIQRYYMKKFELIALHINAGFENFDPTILQQQAELAGIQLFIKDSDIKQIVFDIRKEENPCSLCANLRRGMLNSVAKEQGCNKIALGHNEDDVLETLIMNFVYAGKLGTISPTSYMDRSDMTVIRPMIYTTEKDNRAYARKNNIPIMPKICPEDGKTSREFALNTIKEFEKQTKFAKTNMMGAIKRANISGWHE